MSNSKRQIIVLSIAVILLICAQLVAGIEKTPRMGTLLYASGGGIDWVAEYYKENGGSPEADGLTNVATTLSGESSSTFTTSAAFPFADVQKAIRSYASVNPDIKGWLYIPNTNINYPVAYRNSGDNKYYLYRDWEGKDYTGIINYSNWFNYPDSAIYMDFRTVSGTSWAGSSRNTVLYGHNWNNLKDPMYIGNYKNLTMFAQLPSYTSIDFATKNPHIYYSTGDLEGIWRVFAVGYCHTTPYFFYNNPNPTKDGAATLIDEWKQRSHITFDVDVNSDDKLLTMTTCTRQYGSMDTQRFVVVARLLRPGESENDKVTAVRNANIKHPDFSLPTRLPDSTTQVQNTNNPSVENTNANAGA